MNHPSRFPCIATTVLAGLIASTTPASAQVVVTNPGLAATSADVRDIFVGDKQFVNGVRVVAVDNAGAQKAFLENVLKIDIGKYNSIWAKKSFREGLNAPLAKATDTEVIDFVKKTPGAIGYVTDASKAAGVTVLK